MINLNLVQTTQLPNSFLLYAKSANCNNSRWNRVQVTNIVILYQSFLKFY